VAKIQEVSAVICETIRLPPNDVENHVRGLRAAERISGGDVGAEESADLLAACLSTDASNSTGPFHLPFAGALRLGEATTIIGPGDADFGVLGTAFPTFGESLRAIIQSMSDGALPLDCVSLIVVTGAGSRLRATINISVVLAEGRTTITALFGYAPITELLHRLSAIPPHVERSLQIGGQVLSGLADLIKGLPYEPPIPDFYPHHERVN
jgi:hypothetical protein